MTIKRSQSIVAIAVSLIMALAYMPCTAFAAEDDEGQDVEALQQAMIEAEGVMNQAKTDMDEAEGIMNQAKATWEAKKADYETADAKATRSETAAAAALQARKDAFDQAKSDAQTAYDNAAAAYNTAKGEYDDAVADYNTKQQALNAAQQEKSALESDVAELETELAEEQRQKATLEEQMPGLQAAVTTATNQWNAAIASADAALEGAQLALDGAGRSFIDKKINEQDGYDLDDMINICRTYSSVALKQSATDENGTTYSTVADAANSEAFQKIVDKACTYDNLKTSIEYIKECNVHRNLAVHNAGSLKVSYQLMGTAIIAGAISEFATGHYLMKGAEAWGFWKSGNSTASAENLAYSSASPKRGWDPFHGWYYEERMQAVADERNVELNQSIVDEILAESEVNGYTYNPYGAPWYQTESSFLSRITGTSIGHYENIINSNYKATGFCYVDTPRYALTGYPYVATQEFNSDTTTSVSVDQYEQELDAWFEGFLADLDNAQSARDALQSKPQTLLDAEAAVTDAQSEIEAKTTLINTISSDVITKNNRINELVSEIDTKQAAVNDAGTTVNTKETARNQAQAVMAEKETANTKAQALDPEKPATYEDYPDLVNAVNEAAAAQTIAANDRSAAAAAKTAANEAEGLYTTARTEYNTKKSVYDTAAADYNTAKAAYEAATRVSIDGAKVVLSKTSFTYNGYVQKPAINTIGGMTLTAGTDYTAVWSNASSKNAGTYTVTVTGKGGYTGVAKASYKILKASNPMTVKGKTATVKYSKVKKRTQTVKRSAVLYVAKSQGTVTYVKSSGNKKIIISKSTGKVTVKKGIKKGKYKVKVKVTAAGNSNYYKKTLTRTFTIRVK